MKPSLADKLHDQFSAAFAFLFDFRLGHSWLEVAVTLSSAFLFLIFFAGWYRWVQRQYGRRRR